MSPEKTAEQTTTDRSDAQYTPDAIDTAISKLQSLADVQLKLQKERNSITNLELIQKMLDGELLSEDELTTVKTALKGLSKYAALHNSYKVCLEEAQQARHLIDQIIGSPFITKSTAKASPSENGHASKEKVKEKES
jgi:predicted transcriptional regulator